MERGEFVAASLAYEEATELHSDDVRAWLGLAAVRHKLGEEPLSVDAFARAASIYVEQGHGLKAIAVYKQATRIAPMRDDLALELATQYRHQGLHTEAVEQLLCAMTARANRGEPLDCLSVLRTTLELDQENLADRVRLAEEFSARNRSREALEIFSEIIARLDVGIHQTIYEAVARRMAHLGELPVCVRVDLARIELARGRYGDALELLSGAHEQAPRDLGVLEAVAAAFEGLGQVQPALVALRHLAEAHTDAHHADERHAVVQRILRLAPDDPWARRAADGGSALPGESLVFTEHAQAEGQLERTLSADDAVEAQLSNTQDEDDTSLVEQYSSGLDALFAASSPEEVEEPVIEEIATRDIVAVQDAEGLEILATRDILTVELGDEELALLDGDDRDEEPELLLTRDILSVDLNQEELEALGPEDDEDASG